MTKERTSHYEAMFLISQAVAADFGDAIDHIRDILTRAGAEIVAMKKWDERRLAFEIDKQKRGVYILAYLSCPTGAIAKITHDTNLSEKIMRCMIVCADHLTVEEMQAADAAQALSDEARLRNAPRGVDDIDEIADVEIPTEY